MFSEKKTFFIFNRQKDLAQVFELESPLVVVLVVNAQQRLCIIHVSTLRVAVSSVTTTSSPAVSLLLLTSPHV